MPGVTKRIYLSELKKIHEMWSSQLKDIEKVLPHNYTKNDIIYLLQDLFPHEWKSVQYKKEYYDIKDKHLRKRLGKNRYCMLPPERLIEENPKFISMMSLKNINLHNITFNEKNRYTNEKILRIKREEKIKKVNNKIIESKLYTQSITQDFIKKLIGLYSRKKTTQKDKVYIINELKKYYNKEVINFFFKINDTEINMQLRHIAFEHLQAFNYCPRLRKQKYMVINTKNNKRKAFLKNEYAKQKYNIPKTPEELDYRIFNGKEQSIKEYDYFISHSSKDSDLVLKLKNYQNNNNKFIFCDWINDSDYLKRELLSKTTLKVIEHRLDKSKEMIFLKTSNSTRSIWCQYELNYFLELGKRIFFIEEDDIIKNNFFIREYHKENYYNPNYKELLFQRQ